LQTYAFRVEARRESIYDAFADPAQRSATFDPATSPLYQRLAFVVGAPRSGTTWLQQLLYVHPDVATGGESHLFCEGLPALFANFEHPNGMSHLSTWVARPELVTAARAFCDHVFETQRAATRPDARMVLEKTPNHRLQAALQAALYPDAHYVHIIRDGRDATASQRELWGATDAEFADADRSAAAWAASVRDVRAHFGSLAYLELRYEDVVADTPGALARIFDHLGLASDDALCAAAAEFGRAPVHTSPQSPGVGVRKHAGDALAERAVAVAAGDLLVELGYATAEEVRAAAAQRPRPPRRRLGRRRGGDDDGTVRRVADDVAAGLVAGTDASFAHLADARLTQRRVMGDAATLTFVTTQSERVVVRVVVRRGAAVSVEAL
ncbi:MAG TPA: sulfotransferase, partial [Acidimicrobiales bacterium]|nr:sulfotransferase [Acidimicrobiales bacterium]